MRNIPPEPPVDSFAACRAPPADGHESNRLFESLRPDLLRFACWLSRDQSTAEDVVQEALLRAWRSRSDLKSPAAALPWLLTIVRREHARLYERKRLELTNLDEAIERQDGGLAAAGEGELVDLRTAIGQLPIVYREPLLMQVLGGFTTEEIASELGLSAPAVLTRLFRARNKLRVIYGLALVPDAAESGDCS